MLGAESWQKRGAELTPYLSKGSDSELQMGAVSALADMRSPESNEALVNALPSLSPGNADLALNAILQSDKATSQLLDAIAARKIDPALLGQERINELKRHHSSTIQKYAKEILH